MSDLRPKHQYNSDNVFYELFTQGVRLLHNHHVFDYNMHIHQQMKADTILKSQLPEYFGEKE